MNSKSNSRDLIAEFSRFVDIFKDNQSDYESLIHGHDSFLQVFQAMHSPALLIKLSDGSLLDINQRLLKKLGYNRDEIVNRTLLESGLWISSEFIKSHDDNSKPVDRLVLRLKTQDGEILKYNLEARIVNHNSQKAILCILNESVMEQSVEDFALKFESLVNNSSHGLCVLDKDKHLFANKRFGEITGLPLGYVYQSTPEEVIRKVTHPDYIQIVLSVLNEFWSSNTSTSSVELKIIHPIQGEIWVAIQASKIELNNRPNTLLVLIDIDERKKTFEKVKSEQRLFRTVMNSARDSIFIKNLELRYIVVNASMEELFDKPASELVGKTDDDIFDKEAADHIKKIDALVLSGEEVEEEHEKAVNGKAITFHVIKTPLRDKSGKITGLVGIARDITEREEAKKKIEESELRYRLIVENTRDIIITYLPDGTITYISPQTALYGYSTEEIVGNKIFDYIHPDDLERVARDFQQTLINGQEFTSEFRLIDPKGGDYNYVEAKSTALREGDKVVQLYGVVRDINKRKLVEEALRESEEQYRRLIENMNEGLGAIDDKGTITFANVSICRMLGYSQDELFSMSVMDLLDEQNQQILKDQLKLRQKGENSNYELSWKNKQGQDVHTLMSTVPMYDSTGKYTGSFGIITDITDRKKAEDALKKSEERYRQAVENSPSPIFSVDRRGYIRSWNAACTNLFGYDTDIIGEYYEDIIANKENHKIITAYINEVFQNKTLNDLDIKLITRDGQTRYMVSRLYPVLDERGEVERCVFTNTDITDRKNFEVALQDSEERFRELVEMAPEGVYEIDTKGKITFANKAALEIFGYSKQLLNENTAFASIIAPEDRKRALKNFRKIRSGEKVGVNEYRVIRMDGSVFDATMHSSPIYRNNKVVGARGIIIDVTDRKKAEADLREKELFNRAVIDKSPLGVSVRSRTGKLLSCNKSWQKIWGKSDAEIEQYLNAPEPPSLMLDRRDDYLAPWHDQLKRVYSEGGYLYVPEAKLCYYKEGGNRWVSQHFYAIKNMAGEVDKVVILTEDITERKRATEALKLSEAYYRGLFESAHDAIIVFTPEDEIILDANKSAYEIYGYDRDEFIGMSLIDISEDIGRGKEYIRQVLDKRFYYSFETIQYRKDGTRMILEVNASVVQYNGREVILSVNRDITQRKKAQEELRLSEERFRTVVNSAPIMIFAVNKEGILTFCEGKPLENAGVSKNDLLNKSVFDIYPHPKARKYFQLALEGKLTLYHAEFSGRIFEARVSVSKDENGEVVGITGTTTDITDSLRAKEALKQSEEWLHTIVTASTVTMFAIDTDGLFTFLEGKLLQMLGLKKEELLGKSIFDITSVNREITEYDRCLSGEINNYVFNYMGKVIEARFSPQTNDAREVIGVYGVAIDVTEQKKTESALRAGEEKYRLLVEAAGQPIYSIDHEGKFLTMNNIAAEFLGGKPSDYIGKTMWDLFPQQVANRQMANVLKAIDTGGKLVSESPTVFGNEERWFITTIQAIQNANGERTSALLISNDITQRKRIEVRDKAKSQFLDDLRRSKSINECLGLCCRTIRAAKIFKRATLTLHDENKTIINYGQIGIKDSEVKRTIKDLALDDELTQKLADDKYRISHSYHIPGSDGMLNSIGQIFVDQYETVSQEGNNWGNGDAFFVPLMNENDKPEGWLSADTPFGDSCPELEDIVFIEELVDTTGKKVREIRYLELLENERAALREKNITLREVLAYIEEEKMEIKNQIANEVQNSLLPIVKKLVNPDGKVNNTCYNILTQGLDSLIAPSSAKQIYSKLSPREIEICNMIKTGASSKDISNELNISLATVQKHRENIRKKLKIANKNVNLMTYLKG